MKPSHFIAYLFSLLSFVVSNAFAITASPSTVSATGTYTLTWNSPTMMDFGFGATSLQERVSGGGWYTVSVPEFSTSLQINANTKTPGTTYQYRIQGASCQLIIGPVEADFVCSEATLEGPISVSIVSPPPSMPSTISSTPSSTSGSVSVSWSAVSGATSYNLSQRFNGGSWSTIYSGGSTSRSLSLADGSYEFRVRACNSSGCSSDTSTTTTLVQRTPGIPSGLSVPGNDSDGVYSVSWSTASGTVTRYTLQENTNGGSFSTLQDSGSTSRSISGKGNATYGYRVRACNSLSCSGWSATNNIDVAITPGVPSSISVSPGTSTNGNFSVSWGTSSGSVSQYQLYRQLNGGGWSHVTSGSSQSYSQTGLGDGNYGFRVRACRTTGSYTSCSGYRTSGTNTVLRTPGLPGAISGGSLSHSGTSQDTNGAYSVSWSAASGSVATYELQEQTNNGSFGTIQNTSATSRSISGKGNGTYGYRVRACNASSCSGWTSTKTIQVIRTPGAPGAITFNGLSDPSQSTDSDGGFSVLWGTASNSPTLYRLEQRLNGGLWGEIYSGTNTSKSRSGLGNGTFEYRAQACSALECGSYTGIKTVTVTRPPGSSGPMSVNPGASSLDGTYTVSWNTPTALDYGFGATTLQERVNGGNWNTVNLSEGITSVQMDGSTKIANADYEYRIQSVTCELVIGPVEADFQCSDYIAEGPVSIHIYPSGVTAPPSILTSNEPGSLQLSTSVDREGKLNVTIPLDAPQGINGLTPNLNMGYADRRMHNTRQLPALIGYGWNLNGFSSVYQCGTGIGFALCYGGKAIFNQDRVFGIYPNDVYRTQLDPNKQFTVKVESLPTGYSELWFSLKSGDLTYRFGNTGEGRIQYNSSVNNQLSDHWLLQEVEDAYGNKIIYHYDKIDGYYPYPTSIEYGGNTIEFEYTDRKGTYFPNVDLDLALHTIRTVVDGVTAGEYHIEYELEGGTYYGLKAVQYCGFDQQGQNSTCLPATHFEWEVSPTTGVAYKMGVDKITDGLGVVTDIRREKEDSQSYIDDHLFTEEPFAVPDLDPFDLGPPFDQQPAYEKNWNVTEIETANGIGGTNLVEYAYNREAQVNSLVRRRLPDGHYSYSSHYVDLGYDLSLASLLGFGGEEGQALYTGVFGETGTYLRSKSRFTRGYYESLRYEYVASEQHIVVGDDNSVQNAKVTEITHQPSWNGAYIMDSMQSITNSGSGLDANNNLVNLEKTVTTTTTFDNNTASWSVGFVSNRQVTVSNVPGEVGSITAQQRNTRYEPNMLRVGSSTAFSGSSHELTTTLSSIDSYGNVTAVQVSGPSIAPRSKYINGYQNTNGRYPTTITNAAGHTTSINSYDLRFGAPTSVDDLNGLETQYTIDNLGQLESTTLPNGTVIRPTVEFCGNCDPVAGFLTNIIPTYKSSAIISHSNPAVTTVAVPQATTYFDQLGREIRSEQETFDGTIVRVDTIYDDLGRIYQRSLPYFVGTTIQYATFHHDDRNRVERVEYPDGSETKIQYQSLAGGGARVSTLQKVVRNGATKWQVRIEEYNALGQLIRSKDGATSSNGTTINEAGSVLTEYDYDLLGNNDWVRVDSNNATVVETSTSIAGYPEWIDDPSSGFVQFHYDALGQLKQQTDARGIITEFSYDSIGRLRQRVDDVTGNPITNNWDFDLNNKLGTLSTKSSPGFTETYAYDGLVQLEGITTTLTVPSLGTNTYHASFGYDAYGRTETQTYPSCAQSFPVCTGGGQGVTTFTEYNEFGYAKALRQNNMDGNELSRINATDHHGNVTSKTLGNGLVTNSTFDPFSGLVNSISTGSVQNNQYQRWSDGSLYQRTNTTIGVTESFSYDNLNRLDCAWTVSTIECGNGGRKIDYAYDDLGNLLSKVDSSQGGTVTGYNYSLTANPYQLDRAVINNVTHNFSYDASGNLEFDNASGTANDRTITYNAFGKPMDIIKGSTSSPSARDQFSYGPDGARFHRYSMSGGTADNTLYLLDGAFEVILPTQGTIESIEKTYLGEAVYIREISLTGTNSRFEYLHFDHLGSVEAVTDANGNKVNNSDQDFDPFGGRRNNSWTGVGSPPGKDWQNLHTSRGFTGHEQLDGTGLIHMNGRVYDPMLGRFMSADPIVGSPTFSQDYNRYSYAWNSPTNVIDPSGYDESVGGEGEYARSVYNRNWPGSMFGRSLNPFAGIHGPNDIDNWTIGSGHFRIMDWNLFNNSMYIQAAYRELSLINSGRRLANSGSQKGLANYTAATVDEIIRTDVDNLFGTNLKEGYNYDGFFKRVGNFIYDVFDSVEGTVKAGPQIEGSVNILGIIKPKGTLGFFSGSASLTAAGNGELAVKSPIPGNLFYYEASVATGPVKFGAARASAIDSTSSGTVINEGFVGMAKLKAYEKQYGKVGANLQIFFGAKVEVDVAKVLNSFKEVINPCRPPYCYRE